ncbi:MAG: hypothetical protein IJ163_07845 [Bacteroidaceae bacterium]|nr:hypothetical protein [Bacteroidaceae bacterium]
MALSQDLNLGVMTTVKAQAMSNDVYLPKTKSFSRTTNPVNGTGGSGEPPVFCDPHIRMAPKV